MNIFLIIPSFNEGERLTTTITKALKYFPKNKIIVIDDGSKKPEKIDNNLGVWLLRHRLNLGKGAAMRTGAEFAFENGADAVIYMDADCQHNPDELPKFIKFLNIVFGSRLSNIDAPFVRLFGKKFTSIYINLIFGIYISDTLSGYRGMTKDAYHKVLWKSDRYAVETEMVARLAKHKKTLTWIEFPIETIYMDKYKGMTAIDAIKLMFTSVFWKLN